MDIADPTSLPTTRNQAKRDCQAEHEVYGPKTRRGFPPTSSGRRLSSWELSLLEMFELVCSKLGFEADSLGKGEILTHGALRDIFQGIQQGLVYVDVLKNWAAQNYVSVSDYLYFTTEMCLNILAEYAFQLTSLQPEGLNIHSDTGLVNISYFKFDTDACQLTVPFTLTSNLYEFMTENGVNGPLTFGLKALAKCLAHPNYKLEAILRPILKDEMLANVKRNEGENCLGWETPMETYDPETVTDLVNNAVSAIMNRLSGITGDVDVGKVNELIAAASSVDNLYRMDPSSYHWL
ncbi:Transformation/transcription domain-associated protein [Orchesella cincta]|uniref:Transformation/transcription domain-associated protein n=1 Tax=Orchesella cincta TaxID=48709 RepID=A0A1D2N9M5_ORCCI|nr:Transformation/transcription domain-associated protein [Orchesella cincta]